MSTTTDTDLTTLTDTALDAALMIGYRAHRNAEPDDRLDIHMGIVAIIAEQSRRLEEWRRTIGA
jgi:hypothetical protein